MAKSQGMMIKSNHHHCHDWTTVIQHAIRILLWKILVSALLIVKWLLVCFMVFQTTWFPHVFSGTNSPFFHGFLPGFRHLPMPQELPISKEASTLPNLEVCPGVVASSWHHMGKSWIKLYTWCIFFLNGKIINKKIMDLNIVKSSN